MYVAEEAELMKLASTEEIGTSLFGGMPFQCGYCNGHNTKLNCLEYHRDSEFNLGTEDFILLIAKLSDIDDGIGSCEFFIVKSPIIGVFFSAPSPDSHDFVSKGDVVRPDSVVCIIEAMKVMNEIQAEVNGTIEDILAQNGQAVEFGQPLFKIRLK